MNPMQAPNVGVGGKDFGGKEKAPNCPHCYIPMVIKKGKHGHFFGCSNFPKCKATANKRYPLRGYHRDMIDRVVPGDFNTRKG